MKIIQFNKAYPIVKWHELPKLVRDAVSNYCSEQDIHPHNGTFIIYHLDEEFPFPDNEIDSFLHSNGVTQAHEGVLFHFDY